MTVTPASPAPGLPDSTQISSQPQVAQQVIEASEVTDAKNRDLIALWVLGAAIVAVLLMSVFAIGTAKDRESNVAKEVMASTLPLYGTWVGTILAFYFSRNAFEAASTATARNAVVFQQVSSGALAPGAPPINKLALIPLSALVNGLVFSKKKNDTMSLQDVVDYLTSNNRYRLIYLDEQNGYIDLIYRFDAEAFLKQPPSSGSSSQASGQNAAPTLTIKDYLDWRNGLGEKAKPIVVFLPLSGTLADAYAKINETMGCRDAIVTVDGGAKSVVQAYVTDSDINEYR